MIRRGGANVATPGTFSVEIKCPVQNIATDVSKMELASLVKRHVDGKNMLNLSEGMS